MSAVLDVGQLSTALRGDGETAAQLRGLLAQVLDPNGLPHDHEAAERQAASIGAALAGELADQLRSELASLATAWLAPRGLPVGTTMRATQRVVAAGLNAAAEQFRTD